MAFLICDGLFWLVVLLRILVAFYVPCWFTFVLVYRCGGLFVLAWLFVTFAMR